MTAADNDASRRVIEKSGGIFVEEFITLPSLGSRRELRFRVPVDDRYHD
jgi:predicted acetyltransferase